MASLVVLYRSRSLPEAVSAYIINQFGATVVPTEDISELDPSILDQLQEGQYLFILGDHFSQEQLNKLPIPYEVIYSNPLEWAMERFTPNELFSGIGNAVLHPELPDSQAIISAISENVLPYEGIENEVNSGRTLQQIIEDGRRVQGILTMLDVRSAQESSIVTYLGVQTILCARGSTVVNALRASLAAHPEVEVAMHVEIQPNQSRVFATWMRQVNSTVDVSQIAAQVGGSGTPEMATAVLRTWPEGEFIP